MTIDAITIYMDTPSTCRACAPKNMQPKAIVAAANEKNPNAKPWTIVRSRVFPDGLAQGHVCDDDSQCRHWLLETAE